MPEPDGDATAILTALTAGDQSASERLMPLVYDDVVPEHLGQDVAGNPRIVDGDGDARPIVDIGAYELQR